MLTDRQPARERRVRVSQSQRRTPKDKMQPSDLGPFDPSLFQVLRQVRRAKAVELGVAPFIVFSDRTLRDMVCRKPLDTVSFLQVPGVSDRKCDAFGAEFIAAINAYCEEEGSR